MGETELTEFKFWLKFESMTGVHGVVRRTMQFNFGLGLKETIGGSRCSVKDSAVQVLFKVRKCVQGSW